MNNVMEIFNKIASVSGRTSKESLLKQNMDNKEFTEILTFLYNPYLITGIGKKKMDKFQSYHVTYGGRQGKFIDIINYVVSKNGGISDDTAKEVANYINCQDEELQQFMREVITKDFKCGITANTINKVYGKNFIPKHDIMLAKSWKDEAHKVKGEFIVTEKFDGIRCTAIKEDGLTSFFTRKGLPILGLVELEEEFAFLSDGGVYDGELLKVNPEGLDSKTLFRKTQQVVRKDGIKKGIEFHLYDSLPLSEFKNGKSKNDAYERKHLIFRMLSDVTRRQGHTLNFIKHVPTLYVGTDKAKVAELLSEAIDNGKEGVMVNLSNGKYECKRSGSILKVKEMKTVDLRIIGFEEGEGKNVGTLGRINVDYKGNTLGVGSGFADSDRREIWDNQDKFLGKIVEVQFFETSENEKGIESLRFPVFLTVRDDKDEVSYHV